MDIHPVQHPKKTISHGLLMRAQQRGPRGKEICAGRLTLPSQRTKGLKCKCPCRETKTYKDVTYIQPPRPKNFAPVNVYKKCSEKFIDDTIYKSSYDFVEGCIPKKILPENNLSLPCGRFAKDTINKLSYPGWYNASPAKLARTCVHHFIEYKGPMENVTNYRKEFGPKYAEKQQAYLPVTNISLDKSPLTNITTTKMTYTYPEGTKRELYYPQNNLELPKGTMNEISMSKRAYQPYKLPKKEPLPWVQKRRYEKPCEKMTEITTYCRSYNLNKDKVFEKTQAIMPHKNYNPLGHERTFYDETIYNSSYPGNEGYPIPEKILPENNIYLPTGKVDYDTMSKLAYYRKEIVPQLKQIRPCNYIQLNEGQMETCTTTMREFCPKPIEKVDRFYPATNLQVSCDPMTFVTTTHMTYTPKQAIDVVPKVLPSNNIELLKGKMVDETMTKLSYPAYDSYIPAKRIDPLKGGGMIYCGTGAQALSDTIYRSSYDAPGKFVYDECKCPADSSCCPCPREQQPAACTEPLDPPPLCCPGTCDLQPEG